MVKSERRSELEAKLVAAFVSLGCLFFFVLIARRQEQPQTKIASVPVATPQSSIEQPTPSTKFISTDVVDVKNYKPQVYISE